MVESSNPLQDPQPAGLERAITTTRIIVLALAMGVGIYMTVGTIVAQQGATRGALDTSRIPLVSIAFAALISSVMYRRFNLLFARLELIHAAKGDAGLVNHLFTTTIISAALGEAVGICGLLVGLLTGDTYTMYALCATSLIAILFSLPRANGWREAYSHITTRARAGATSTGLSTRGS